MEFPMPKPYSIDLREKIVTAYENQEGSMQKLAKRFKVSKNFVADLLKRFKQTGQIAPNEVAERPNRTEVDVLHQLGLLVKLF
jgi:transposase